ncbi:flavin reductase family protein [Novosphingobium percolationis]|uniref:flavin reductase family protein n=1 Tax=Novosphingobium percolationis TaxID=2871811 RepID=UPI001CD525F1|nr:flavin reductase family protein [Novosphingobium percolationis]
MSDQTLAAPPTPDAAHRAAFLEQMRRVPGAVAVIAARDGDERGGLVATAWSSLCADPPMLLACVNQSASAHDLIVKAGHFGLSLLSIDDPDIVGHFSGKSGLSGGDRFVEGLWSDGPLGQPLARNAVVAFECEIAETHRHGTHTILIGRVGDMRHREDGNAMLYLDGKFTETRPA